MILIKYAIHMKNADAKLLAIGIRTQYAICVMSIARIFAYIYGRGRPIPYVNQIHLIGLRPSAIDTHTHIHAQTQTAGHIDISWHRLCTEITVFAGLAKALHMLLAFSPLHFTSSIHRAGQQAMHKEKLSSDCT